jgi:hypothetical protein
MVWLQKFGEQFGRGLEDQKRAIDEPGVTLETVSRAKIADLG